MANPEAPKTETQNSEAPKTTAPETADSKVSEEKLSEAAAAELVNDLLNRSDVVQSFNALQTIEKKYKAKALPENIKNIYVKARDEALNQLKNEPVFKELWVHLDTNSNIGEDTPLSWLSEEMADSIVAKILWEKHKFEAQRSDIIRVNENISIFNELQRKYYNLVIEEAENQIVNDPYLKERIDAANARKSKKRAV